MASRAEYNTAVLDTNLVDYGFKPKTKDAIATLITDISKKYTLVISEYLRFEIYRGLSMSKIASAKELVDLFTAYPVDKETLDIAAVLTTCYECDPQTKDRRKSFSDGDIVLAATGFKHKFIVITANRSDFPTPYFNEVGKTKIRDSAQKPIVIYELKPDVDYFNEMLRICYPKPN